MPTAISLDQRSSKPLTALLMQCAMFALAATLALLIMNGTAPTAAAQPVIPVFGYGNYCSATWPGGGSAFAYLSYGGDPCGFINPDGGGTIRRKGLYSSSGWNNVVLRCDQGVWFWTGVGNAPLDWAYNTAYNNAPGKSNCVFTVSARQIAICNSPIFDVGIAAGSGFDFARAPYKTLDVTAFGKPGSKTATKVNYRGEDRSSSSVIDDHAGYDWGIPKGSLLLAVADGRVVRAEKYYKTRDNCNNYEAHVYLEHKVCGFNGYCEKFISYYTHMDSLLVSTGQTVHQGDLIGLSGNSGCVPAHLHYTAARLTNTADKLEETLQFTDEGLTTFQGQPMRINVDSNAYNFAIDPFGWQPLNGTDPWGWKPYGQGLGVMSISLWTLAAPLPAP